jgi:hypothetical protein
MTLATRLDKLETLWSGGDCPVCHGLLLTPASRLTRDLALATE